ncbi:MAG TPA: hypothetical protein VHP36_00270 [Chitinispirillaceae bacterium]|nr:hypothetical protein [Chitinispirillaceae bacterium]
MISKSSQKQCWSFLKETALFKGYLLAFLIPFTCLGFQLENWRQPFFTIASEMGLSNGSASRMFWDDISDFSIFDSSLWITSNKLNLNHWFIEPNIEGGFLAASDQNKNEGYYHIDLLNNLRFRNLSIRQTVDADKRYEDDPLYPAHTQRAVRARIEDAYMQLDWKYGFFRLGRLKRNWGPFSDRSLILSANPYSYDAFEWQIHSSFFEFRHLFAPFYSERYYATDNGYQTNRFLTAHSINLIFGQWATLGVSEAVVFSREKSFPDMHYLNPVSIYTVVNTNQEGAGNLMLAFQWNVHPFVKFITLKGQVLLDDFQVDNELVTDKEPAHYGIDMGIYWNNPFKIPFEHLLKTEFSRHSQWLYTVTDMNADLGERYTYNGKSLGAPSNDGDRFSTGFTVVGRNFWYGTAELAFQRNGIRNVLSRWRDSEPGKVPGLPDDSPDVMEKTFCTGMNAGFYFRNLLDLRIGFSGCWTKNKDNIAGSVYEFSPSVSAGLSLHYSNLFIRLPQ